jgi:hypothetical protein
MIDKLMFLQMWSAGRITNSHYRRERKKNRYQFSLTREMKVINMLKMILYSSRLHSQLIINVICILKTFRDRQIETFL